LILSEYLFIESNLSQTHHKVYTTRPIYYSDMVPEIENPHKPDVIEEGTDFSIIECPRCTSTIPTITHYPISQTRSKYIGIGEKISEVDEENIFKFKDDPVSEVDEPISEVEPGPMSEVDEKSCEIEPCDVCNGTERLEVPYTKLPTCIRCHGRGFVAQRSERLESIDEYLEQIDELEDNEALREARKGRLMKVAWMVGNDGPILNKIKVKLKVAAKVAIRNGPYGKDKRYLKLSNCPSCGGSGVDDDDRATEDGFITDCQRCHGTGRMVTESSRSPTDNSMTVEDGCEACGDTGETVVHTDPPFVRCSNCEGWGHVKSGKSVSTCTVCHGTGFLGRDEVQSPSAE